MEMNAEQITLKSQGTKPAVSSPEPPSSLPKRVLVFDILEERLLHASAELVTLCEGRQQIVPWMKAVYHPDQSGSPQTAYLLGPPRIEELREEKGEGKATVGGVPLKQRNDKRLDDETSRLSS